MNNDRLVIEWFEKQLVDDRGLKNIFTKFDAYTSFIKEEESILKYTKSIRQDLQKIFFTIERIFYIENLFYKNNDVAEFFNYGIIGSRKNNYQGIDLEFILIKYRSILDYCVDLIKDYFPSISSKKVEAKYQYLNDVLESESEFNKHILSSKWYQDIKGLRDNIVHHGASYVVFPGKELGFQIYDLDVENLYVDEDYLKVNENVYSMRRFLILHIAYLYYFLDKLLNSIVKKNDKLLLSHSVDTNKRRVYMEETIGCLPNYRVDILNISICSLLNEFINEIKNSIDTY